MKVNSIKQAEQRWKRRVKIMLISAFVIGAALGSVACGVILIGIGLV